ncbi:SLAP domain-containing protein [Hathewaya massiliensis]|uniref:SLAP domain-containing protein n=1 Tax=Hathewaya massiliensis TaxID=1964382 RepID=UPI001158C8A5|nr:SLAP domain-containing protein [Hathewaya massiliensis]
MSSLFDKLFKKPIDINSQLEKRLNIEEMFKDKMPLNFDYGTSEFKKENIYKEYKKIPEYKEENLLTIETVYTYHGFEGIEAGVFFINTSNNPVELYNIEFSIINKEGKVKGREVVNFKGDVRIEANSSFYYEFLFKGLHINELEKDLSITFSSLEELKVSAIKDMDMENFLQEDLPEASKEFFREKFYGIPSLREGEFIIDPIFALGEEDGINVILLLRNGSNRDIVLNSIPISISLKEDLPIYIGSINLSEQGVLVQKNKGKLLSLKVPRDVIMLNPIKDYVYKLSLNQTI